MKNEAVIRMHSYEPVILTTEEYETLQREVIGHAIANPGTVGARILAKLAAENHSRYVEAWEQNSGENHPVRLTSQENKVQ